MAPPPVPSQYAPYIQQAAAGTKLPIAVVEEQAFVESGYNPGATSPAGAKGFWQFMPGTYNSVAARAGVPPGTEYNIADETKAYVVYMNQVLKDEGGNVFKALEAYNAGEGNLSAGSGYASKILSSAGQSNSLNVSGGTTPVQATLTGFPNPLNIPGDLGNAVSGAITGAFSSLIQGIFNALGVPTLKDLFQRLALILLGVALVLVGIRIISQGSSSKSQPFTVNVNETRDETTGTTRTTKETKHPLGKTRKTTITGGTGKAANLGASDAIEAAAVA